ncbi:MAG: serine/threonine-protein kinase [Thermoanaerobaculia bacterium]|nr:serine/threonine-protein kinase [Thermoanaerobaculia bacterium]
MSLTAGTKLGPYEILAPLGAGGMGEVYRARDPRLGREVALKVLPAEVLLDKDRLSRFEQEARSASALNHPNVITIYDIGQAEQVSYIAMELVEGKTLRELCTAEPLPVRRAIGIAVQIAEGLAKAHASGIVHRDLKPENVMVSRDGYVKILDFGLAKLMEPESGELSASPTLARPETHPGTVLGTVGYMSPEQASGQPLDFHSDQFSFGSIVYEITAGQKAFARKTAAETMSAIIREEPEPLVKLRPDVPPPLRWIIERCLAKDPEERYASTRDLARDLAGVRDHISEVSSAAERISAAGPARRRRLTPALAAAAVVAAGIVTAAALWRVLPGKTSSSPPRFQQLTFRRGTLNNARFSPDGQTILYGATWTGEKGRLYATRPGSPESWAPDLGSKTWDILGVSPSGELAVLSFPDQILARVPLAGGVPRDVVAGVPYASADWASDGKDLVIVRESNRRFRLEFPIGKVLLESSQPLNAPRISPGGDRISYCRLDRNTNTICVMETTGKGVRDLSGGWADISGVPCWSPDGREIWFSGKRPGEGLAIHAVDLSGKLRLVTRVPGTLELDDIFKDGRLLVAHHAILIILVGRIAGEQKDRDFSWLDYSSLADLSADGKTLLIFETGLGAGALSAVYIRKTDGSAAVRLGEGWPLALSPDGSTVLASVEPPGSLPRLVLLPTGAGEAKPLSNERFVGFDAAQWLPDGKRIVFSANEKDRPPRVYVRDLLAGKESPITPEGVALEAVTKTVSPDGRSVVAISDGGKVSVFPIDGGDPRPVVGLNPGDRVVQWTSDGRFLYVLRREEMPVKVWLLDPTTGNRRLFKEIVPAEPANSVWNFLITPDGQSYVCNFQRAFSNLYLVEGLR